MNMREEKGGVLMGRFQNSSSRKISPFNGSLLVILALVLILSSVFFWGRADAITPPAGSPLTSVGPINGENGFPVWYKDANGKRLQLCLDKDDPYCGFLPGDIPDDTKPISFPNNFPQEAFYQMATAKMETGTGAKVVGDFNLEASFVNGKPIAGEQIVFGRIRFYIFGLTPGREYTITHPYGIDKITAEPDKNNPSLGQIKYTQDIGDLNGGNFQLALNSRVGPFLKWDSTAPAAPKGYLGDPAVEHPIVGSTKTNGNGEVQNFFRVEGEGIGIDPVTKALSPNACSTNSANCIEVKNFTIMGKEAVTAGVEAQQATYSRTAADGGIIDVFATSEDAQSIEVSGAGIDPVRMLGANGQYFARVAFTGAPPKTITVKNAGDAPPTVKEINVVDQITATAEYNTDTKKLTVQAASSDGATPPVLSAKGFGDIPASGTLIISDMNYAPPTVTITSTQGGSVTIPIKITGGSFAPVPVSAFAGADQTVVIGNSVTLDGSNSTGPITSYSWRQITEPTAGPTVQLTGANTVNPTFTAPSTPGTLQFELTITGPGGPQKSTTKVTVIQSAPAPVAIVGPNQNVKQGTLVTLDGSASKNTTTYKWVQKRVSGDVPVTLNLANTAKPTFTFPKQNTFVIFTLTATGPGGTATSSDVKISAPPDVLTVSRAEYVTSGSSWRIDGTSDVFGPGVKVTIYIFDPKTSSRKLLGTADVDSLGAFRYRNTGPVISSGQTLSLDSSSGGKLTNVQVRIK
jgi:hypothetical protein